MRVDFLSVALRYAERGWHVFPLGANSKLPAIKGGHGVKDATTDESQIREWAKSVPHANVGLACGKPSGLFVVDIDPRNGGERSIAELAAKGFAFPPVPIARTGGGGKHLFFRFDPRIANSKNRLGRGVDVKSTGGYVVAPPSRVRQADGSVGKYEWIRAGQLMAPPAWLLEKLAPPTPPPRFSSSNSSIPSAGRIRDLLIAIENAPQGERNNTLYRIARCFGGLVYEHKMARERAESLLMASAVAAGLPSNEAIRTIRSGFDGRAAVARRAPV